jgi:hypothetical protein
MYSSPREVPRRLKFLKARACGFRAMKSFSSRVTASTARKTHSGARLVTHSKFERKRIVISEFPFFGTSLQFANDPESHLETFLSLGIVNELFKKVLDGADTSFDSGTPFGRRRERFSRGTAGAGFVLCCELLITK